MKCKFCGEEIDNDSVFCEYCGAKITKKNSGSKWFLWLCFALVLIAAGTVVFWKLCNNKKAEAERNGVINTINLYNDANMSNDLTTLSLLYADNVNRFHDMYNVSNAEVIEHCRNYDATFKVISKHSDVRWNTLQINGISPDEISVVYVEDYTIERKDKSKYSKFVLEKHLILDRTYRITSVYDVQLSKSR